MAQDLKNIYQGKTPAQVAKMKRKDYVTSAKIIAGRKKEEPKNSEGRTAKQEAGYMKAMKENEMEVKKIDDQIKADDKVRVAGRLAAAAKRAKIKP
jgi:hypothetical protein